MNSLINFFFGSPRRLLAIIAACCAALLAFAFYLQHSLDLEPCPMCILQRISLMGVGIAALIGSIWGHKMWVGLWGFLAWAIAGFGGFVAARQSFLQWYPPEFATCGRDFYGVLESNFPLREKLPMFFKGTADCSMVDWTMLGLSIANWSFIAFAGFFIGLTIVALRKP